MKYIQSLFLLATFAVTPAALGMERIQMIPVSGPSIFSLINRVQPNEKELRQEIMRSMQGMPLKQAMSYLEQKAITSMAAQHIFQDLWTLGGNSFDWMQYACKDDDLLLSVLGVVVMDNEYRKNILTYLLDNGFDANKVYAKYGWTPLFYAVLHNNDGTLEILLAHHANPLVFDKDGNSPLRHATYSLSGNKIHFAWANREVEQALLGEAEDAWRCGEKTIERFENRLKAK